MSHRGGGRTCAGEGDEMVAFPEDGGREGGRSGRE